MVTGGGGSVSGFPLPGAWGSAQRREGRAAVVVVPGKGGEAAGGQYRRPDCQGGLGMRPVPPAALSPPGGVGRDRLPPAAADGERRNESEPELPPSPGAPGGAGPQCGGRAGGQRDPRTREVSAAAGGGSTAAALTWRTALRASGDGAGVEAGHRGERCGGAAGPLLPQSSGRGRAAGPPASRPAGARRPP